MSVRPIELRIDSLVLEGLMVQPRHAVDLQGAIERELGRLLRARAPNPRKGATFKNITAPPIRGGGSPAALGKQVARSIYSALGRTV